MKDVSTPKRESGGAFKAIVRICGLIGITAFFLPFFNGHSGVELIQDLLNGKSPLDLVNAITKDRVGGSPRQTPDSLIAKVIGALFLFSIMAFTLIAAWMTVSGRYWGGALTLLIIVNVAAWILVQFVGSAGLDEPRFYIDNAGPGYLVANSALFAPFIGMFFFDKSVR
jgi:hypothetical protein